MAKQILITPRSMTAGRLDNTPEFEPLRAAGFELVASPAGRLPEESELIELFASGNIVGWLAGVEKISATVLDAAGGLKVIARNGVGADNVDIDAAQARSVEVRTVPGANAQGVAELALAHGLGLLRGIPQGYVSLRDGGWLRTRGRELAETRVGIVGFGEIGRRTGKLFAALGAPVAFYDPFVTDDHGLEKIEDLDELISRSDLLSLHVPPSPEGPLLNVERIAKLPKGALVVNTARSALVDAPALAKALASGAVAGYAVDAFDTEPPELDELLMHENTVMSAHVGGFTGASVTRATVAAVEQLLDVLG